VGSGRTDAGVHASGQVAHFDTDRSIREWNLTRGWNTRLPGDLRVLAVQKVADDFHAQHFAKKKQYSYYFITGVSPPAHLHPFGLHVSQKLNLSAMREALKDLVGKHDFKAFQASGSKPALTTVREIFEAELEELSPGAPGFSPQSGTKLIRLRFVGSGFLKQMIRALSGTLLEIGQESRPASNLKELLSTPSRKEIGATLAPHGLWMERVEYPGLSWDRLMEGEKKG